MYDVCEDFCRSQINTTGAKQVLELVKNNEIDVIVQDLTIGQCFYGLWEVRRQESNNNFQVNRVNYIKISTNLFFRSIGYQGKSCDRWIHALRITQLGERRGRRPQLAVDQALSQRSKGAFDSVGKNFELCLLRGRRSSQTILLHAGAAGTRGEIYRD